MYPRGPAKTFFGGKPPDDKRRGPGWSTGNRRIFGKRKRGKGCPGNGGLRRLDILVNSIGAQVRKPALEVSEKDWEYLMGINLKAVYFLGQAAAKEMMKTKRGKIINISSLTSFIGIPNISVYGASKGGILTLTRHWAVEWARYNINVNAIGPGYFKTGRKWPIFFNE